MSNTLPALTAQTCLPPPPRYRLQQMCLGLLCSAAARRIHHGSTPWETAGTAPAPSPPSAGV